MWPGGGDHQRGVKREGWKRSYESERREKVGSPFVLAVIVGKEEHPVRTYVRTYTRYLRVRARAYQPTSSGATVVSLNTRDPIWTSPKIRRNTASALYVCGHIYGCTGWLASNRTSSCPFYLSFHGRNFLGAKLPAVSRSTRNGGKNFLLFFFFFSLFLTVALRIFVSYISRWDFYSRSRLG